MLNQQQISLFGKIQTSQTGGQPYNDTSPMVRVLCSCSSPSTKEDPALNNAMRMAEEFYNIVHPFQGTKLLGIVVTNKDFVQLSKFANFETNYLVVGRIVKQR